MFNSIYRSLRFLSDLFQPHPNQDSTPDMVSDNPVFSTLASLQPGQLFGFTMKLLNLPTKATHFLYSLRIVLSHFVCYDIVRALGRQHHSKQFHFVIFWKAFYHTMCIPTVLPPNHLDFVRVVLIGYGIIKHNITVVVLHHLSFHIVPNQMWRNFVSS